jgi:hypothetical protein
VLSSMRKSGKRMSPDPISVFAKIMVELRLRYRFLNLHYEAAWTDSWIHCRCLHEHQTLIEAAKCAMPRGAGWYVFVVEGDAPRELNETEDRIANEFRFGVEKIAACSRGSV